MKVSISTTVCLLAVSLFTGCVTSDTTRADRAAPRGETPPHDASRQPAPAAPLADGGGAWAQPRDERRFGEWPEVRPMSAAAIDAHLTTGDRRFDAGDFHGAIDAYSQALRIDPELSYAFCNRGSARRRLRDYRGAILDLTQAIRLRRDYALAYNNRGYARLLNGEAEAAVADFDRALEIGDEGFPSYSRAMTYRNRAKAYRALGDEARAQEDERRARRADGRRRVH